MWNAIRNSTLKVSLDLNPFSWSLKLITDTNPYIFYLRLLPLTIMIVLSGTTMAENMRTHAPDL